MITKQSKSVANKDFFFWQEFSPDGQFIVSADRDFKIRVILRFFPFSKMKWFCFYLSVIMCSFDRLLFFQINH